KLTTLVSVTVSLFVGAVILISNHGSDWHVAQATVSSLHRTFSKDKIDTELGVHIGLNSVNITLQTASLTNPQEEINYNERFNWIGATEIKEEYREALIKGLPFPILTIAEYLSQDLEGFCWGRRYRMAGYYSYILLWTAFALWLLMDILLCTVPRYGAFCLQLTGAAMLLTNAIYALLLPRKPLVIPFEEGTITFEYGWCFWLVLGTGSIALMTGLMVVIVDILFPNKFITILEVDYDTPYRYFVRQTSRTTAKQKSNGQLKSSQCRVPESDLDAPSCSRNGIGNFAYENDDSDGSIIINGKRAVSLHHFGNYAERETTRRGFFSAISR
ncbi:dual oxidase maturation factor 1-like, partial [Limulus polyphemus]|uniref:Dual oxidase maturation factor 1-like n=1 Tax=Limulus polyphemus TaxID=6850 RepID=A0ABM1BVC5_LIMPO